MLRNAYSDLKKMAPEAFPKAVLNYPLSVFRGDAFR